MNGRMTGSGCTKSWTRLLGLKSLLLKDHLMLLFLLLDHVLLRLKLLRGLLPILLERLLWISDRL
jgi:hypothetical protein